MAGRAETRRSWSDFSPGWQPDATNYLIWDDEDGIRIIDDPQHVFDRQTVSIIAIDLAVIGARLMAYGRKPLMSLLAPEELGRRRIRRLTGITI